MGVGKIAPSSASIRLSLGTLAQPDACARGGYSSAAVAMFIAIPLSVYLFLSIVRLCPGLTYRHLMATGLRYQ